MKIYPDNPLWNEVISTIQDGKVLIVDGRKVGGYTVYGMYDSPKEMELEFIPDTWDKALWKWLWNSKK
ncbi:hypothetical protein [Klebsiella pneumoniae]|uniref:hypothetical protein n=1 Tax=Klebsiella pneumoniae TaxID=573 RepID=UPI00115E15C1|nr:hypothetical protein [Klebsiella pneumoniae]